MRLTSLIKLFQIALISLATLLSPQIIRAAELKVQLDNPPAAGSSVALVLFDSANAFGDLRDPYRVTKHIIDGREDYIIENIEAGEYALLVYFDENNNNRIDKNFIGIPKEPLGFSNNYEPKGPPSYQRAAFQIQTNESRTFNVKLYRPLGDLGRIGVGIGMIFRSSPYKDYSGNVSQIIPAITYTGERLQIFGPKIQLGLIGSGKLRLAATGRYRIGVYKEEDSPFLEGMGDRESTFMGGLAIQAQLPKGFDVSASYEHDLLDNIGGGEARLAVNKSFQFGIVRVAPAIAGNWISAELSNHDFGVPVNQATADRPAYKLNDVYSLEAGIGIFIEITSEWLVIINVANELLSDEVTDSPIVTENNVIKGFAAINYIF